MNGRNGTATFLPLDSKLGGQGRNDRPSVAQFSTREQTNYIYKKIETGNDKYRYNTTKDGARRKTE